MCRFMRVLPAAAVALCLQAAHAELAQEPLFLGGGNVPGNLAIVPSVEWPTVLSAANLDTDFNRNTRYVGYFDSDKCYDYIRPDADRVDPSPTPGSVPDYDPAKDRHFQPIKTTVNMSCPGPFWSGNYLNWATTQTIDPFRLALTGGLRVVDTPTTTWVSKARSSNQGGTNTFPNRTISGNQLVKDMTPFDADSIETFIIKNGYNVEFKLSGRGTIQGDVNAKAVGLTLDEKIYTFSDDKDDWKKYGDGVLEDKKSFNGRDNVILKKKNNDPHGGYDERLKDINHRDFILQGWFAYHSENKGGSLIRLSVSNNNPDGYGPVIGEDYIAIERRDNGAGSRISNDASFKRKDDTWYWFEFKGDSASDTFTLTVFDKKDGNVLASVTSNKDDRYNSFKRLYIHGGREFFVDDLEVWTYKNSGGSGATWPYDSASNGRYKAAVRVAVCVPGLREDHCQQYSQGWKPEGLMQEYADTIRYSVFGYLNDSKDFARDGGVLRARQKFIGQRARDPNTGWAANSAPEWNPVTGVLYTNPDSNEAQATSEYYGVTIENSGAINYLNQFGHFNSNNYKSKDPVSELYYAATRYFRGLPVIDQYISNTPAHDSSPSEDTLRTWLDNFPVITEWDNAPGQSGDPIQYSCQKSVFLGIGDVNTHADQNLPGSTSSSNEPTMPELVKNDPDINVNALNKLAGDIEEVTLTDNNRFGSTKNAGYMIGLAFDANTRDQRADWPGKQTFQTYWVDVLENQKLQPINRNQYWLTAKYGGFVPRCPADDPSCTLPTINDASDVTKLPEHWWFTNGETLTQSGANLKRADNYFAAGQADKMVEGLRKAFAAIAASMRSTASALSFNSTRLRAGSYVFQGLFDNTRWSGDLRALAVSKDGVVATVAKWSAAEQLDALADVSSRMIITPQTATATGKNTGGVHSTAASKFLWAELTNAQRAALQKDDEAGATVSSSIAQQRVDYIRGDRSREGQDNFRRRDTRLGDIINSDPQYIFNENYGYNELGKSATSNFASSVGDAYDTFRSSNAYTTRSPLVVVGANDGMLHVFNADTGNELLAYVPGSAYDTLYQFTKPDYVHRYYVDGTPRLADAWLGSSWHTLAVGTGGAGGQSVFALDLTKPSNLGPKSFLWEYSNSKMGKLVQQPALVALPTGGFGVIVTSGYDAPQVESYVWVLDAKTGKEIAEIELPTGELGSPLVIDVDGDRIADRVYVGGSDGKLWRIDISDKLASKWGSKFKSGKVPAPLFTAVDNKGDPQPITAPLTAAKNASGNPVVLFGTGSFIDINDSAVGQSPQVNTFYGIQDTGVVVTGRSDLTQQIIIGETGKGAFSARAISANPLGANAKGWYLDLLWQTAEGERVVSKASIQGSQVIFSTLIPSADPCKSGGESWIMALNIKTGGRWASDIFDFNEDGVVDAKDSITIQDAQGNDIKVPGSGIMEDPSSGIIKSPSVVASDTGERYVCFAGSSNISPKCVLIQGGLVQGRQSWRELIGN